MRWEKGLAEVETEDIVVDPIVCGIGRIRDEVESLGKLHWVGSVVDYEIAADGDYYAVGLYGGSGLTVDGDYTMLDLLKGEALWILGGWLGIVWEF